MQVPSGAVYGPDDLQRLKDMHAVGFVRWSDQPFILKSGLPSHIYIFGREDLTDHPQLEYSIGRKIAQTVWSYSDYGDRRQQCLIGIPTAGTALAQAGAMASVVHKLANGNESVSLIGHRIMREQIKRHGAHHTWVNGKPNLTGQRYWLVDNVATDGKSKFEASEKLEADGYPKEQVSCLIWIDREQGAVAKLKSAGFKQVIVVYNLLDITHAFVEMGCWPKGAAIRTEEEIKAHQFA